MSEEFKNEHVQIWIDGDFIHAQYLVDVIDLNAAKSVIEGKFALLSESEMMYNIIHSQKVKKMTPEARRYLSQPVAYQGVKATAILARSPVGAVLGNFYLRFGNFPIPTRLFRDEGKAKEWLVGLNI